MKTKNLFSAIILAGALAFAGCDVNDAIHDDTGEAVRFTAGIDHPAVAAAYGGVRAAGATWAANDAIGVFMVGNGTAAIAGNAVNRQYVTTGGNAFTAATGDEIYYPMDGSAVDFIAYYPYKSGTVLATPVDVEIATAQTAANQPDFDLLYAKADNGGAGYGKASHATTPVALAFDHKLAKMVMNVEAGAGVTGPLAGMTVTIKGMNTQSAFDLATGAFGAFTAAADITPRTLAGGAEYDAIVLPCTYAAGDITVEFTINPATNPETFVWTPTAAHVDFAPGYEYTYDVSLDRTGVQVTATINPWATIDRGDVAAE